jgi:negative regulator of flagellin synthesis FlgM
MLQAGHRNDRDGQGDMPRSEVMSDIAPNSIGRAAAAAINRPPTNGHGKALQDVTRPTRGADRVEFSQTAQLLSRLQDMPDIRFDLVARVKAEIAAGTYETPDKLDAALEGLIDDLA